MQTTATTTSPIEGLQILVTGQKIVSSGSPIKNICGTFFRIKVEIGDGKIQTVLPSGHCRLDANARTAVGDVISGAKLVGLSKCMIPRDFKSKNVGTPKSRSGKHSRIEFPITPHGLLCVEVLLGIAPGTPIISHISPILIANHTE